MKIDVEEYIGDIGDKDTRRIAIKYLKTLNSNLLNKIDDTNRDAFINSIWDMLDNYDNLSYFRNSHKRRDVIKSIEGLKNSSEISDKIKDLASIMLM